MAENADAVFEACARAEGKCGKCRGAKEILWWDGTRRRCPYCGGSGDAQREADLAKPEPSNA